MDRFTGTLLEGHKGAACEVPFDPAVRWGILAGPLWRGRRGHRVLARIGRLRFESFVVSRARRFWLLVPEEVCNLAGIAIGRSVRIAIEPEDRAGPATSARRRPARKRSGA